SRCLFLTLLNVLIRAPSPPASTTPFIPSSSCQLRQQRFDALIRELIAHQCSHFDPICLVHLVYFVYLVLSGSSSEMPLSLPHAPSLMPGQTETTSATSISTAAAC